MSMEMVTDRAGVAESGRAVPVGVRCAYEGHLPGGAVRVRLPDGSAEIVSASIFAQLR